MKKKSSMLAILLTVLLCLTSLNPMAVAAAQDKTAEGDTGTITVQADSEMISPDNTDSPDPDELFSLYVDNAFSSRPASGRRLLKKSTGIRLTGNDAAVYAKIADCLPAIASGERASTVIEIFPDDLNMDQVSWTAGQLGVSTIITQDENGNSTIANDAVLAVRDKTSYNMSLICRSLLADFPYQLYWYDKTQSISRTGFRLKAEYNNEVGDYTLGITGSSTISFPVASEFAAGEYTVNTSIGQSVQTSVANANEIVSKYSAAEDYEKLCGYKDEICNLVSYNYDAAAGGVSYGNPWQMIWVFDGDPSTNVVCEGYAKAFKYLCDQSSFNGDISCITVNGVLSGATGAGPHMWDIVNMEDGNNYLVDITNCDEGMVGAPDQLFLSGASLDPDNNGYTVSCSGADVGFSYDDSMFTLYTEEELTLSTKSYVNVLEYIENGLVFYILSDRAEIAGYDGTEQELILPETVLGVPVVAIDDHAFYWAYQLQKIYIPGTITKIGYMAFYASTIQDVFYELSSEEWQKITIDEYNDVFSVANMHYQASPEDFHVHVLEKRDSQDASCETNGNIEYWICSGCGAFFSDENGTNEITLEDIVIPATGHSWSSEYTVDKEPTCMEEGIESIHCTVCGAIREGSEMAIEKLDHIYGEWETVTEPTCMEAGSRKQVCSECGDTLTEEIPAIGHSWGEPVWKWTKNESGDYSAAAVFTCERDPSHSSTVNAEVRKTETSETVTYTAIVIFEEKPYSESKVIQFGWRKNSTGWWYQNADGTYPKSKWQKIDGKWYYFNDKGYRYENKWLKSSSKWYYFQSDGVMATGWLDVGSSRYYFNSSGVMAHDTWQGDYYLTSGGKMATDTWIGDKYVDATGKYDPTKVKEGTWKHNSTGWWYQNPDGTYPKSKWQKIDGKWYYFNDRGYRYENKWLKLSGKWYYFQSDGVMVTGWQKIGSSWYYFNSSGVMAHDTWQGDYYLTSSGKMAKDTWIGDKYVDSSGKWDRNAVKES